MGGRGGHRYHKCFGGEFRSFSHRPDPRRPRRAVAELPDSGSSSAELRGRPARHLQTDPTGRAVAAPKLRAAPGAAGRLLARHAEDEPGAMLGEIRLRLVDPRLHGDGALPAVQAALHRVSHADAQRALLAAKQRAAVSTAPAPRDARPRPGALCEPLPRAAAPIPLRRLFLLRLSGPRCGLSSPRHTPARGPARPSVGRDEAAGSVPNNGSGALPRLGLPTRLCHKPAGAARLPAELRPRRDRRRHTEPSRAQEIPGSSGATSTLSAHPGNVEKTSEKSAGSGGGRVSAAPLLAPRLRAGQIRPSAAPAMCVYLLQHVGACGTTIPRLDGVPTSAPQKQNRVLHKALPFLLPWFKACRRLSLTKHLLKLLRGLRDEKRGC